MRPHCCFSDRRESAAGPWWRSLWPVHPMGCRGHASRDKDPGLGFCLGQSRPGNAPASLCPGKGRLAWFLSVPLNIDIPAGFLFACGRVIRRDPYRPNIGQIGTNIVIFWPYYMVRITGLRAFPRGLEGPLQPLFWGPLAPCFEHIRGCFAGPAGAWPDPCSGGSSRVLMMVPVVFGPGAFEASPFFSVAWPVL